MGVATWNVRGLNNKMEELKRELKASNIELVGLTETKLKGSGEILLSDGDLLIYSGVDTEKRARAGVAAFIKKNKP